jgi:alpha-mannosidase
LDTETRPQISWTAFSDGHAGLAVVSRGLPESAVIDRADRPIALTLLRAFRKAVFSGDNIGGQIQGTHIFRYDLVPFSGQIPVTKLFIQGQRINSPVRQTTLHPADLATAPTKRLPRSYSFAAADGDAVVTSIQRQDNSRVMRVFNPLNQSVKTKLGSAKAVRSVSLDGQDEKQTMVERVGEDFVAKIGRKRIATFVISQS